MPPTSTRWPSSGRRPRWPGSRPGSRTREVRRARSHRPPAVGSPARPPPSSVTVSAPADERDRADEQGGDEGADDDRPKNTHDTPPWGPVPRGPSWGATPWAAPETGVGEPTGVAGILAHGPRAAHSCGSASVSHRLPPSRQRCHRDRPRPPSRWATAPPGTVGRSSAGASTAAKRRARAPRGILLPLSTVPRFHAVTWLAWALAAVVIVQLASSPLYVTLVLAASCPRGRRPPHQLDGGVPAAGVRRDRDGPHPGRPHRADHPRRRHASCSRCPRPPCPASSAASPWAAPSRRRSCSSPWPRATPSSPCSASSEPSTASCPTTSCWAARPGPSTRRGWW